MSDKIKILIAEDRIPLLHRYKRILASDNAITVCSEVTTGIEAVKQAAIYKPDIILMDIEMETQNAGLEASEKILKQFPEMKIIILTVFSDEKTVFSAFQLGAVDYILKEEKQNELINAVKNAYGGISSIRPEIAAKLRNKLKKIKQNQNSFIQGMHFIAQLTPMETEILHLMGQKHTRAEICSIRHVELSTLKTEIHTILKKSGCTSIAELICILKDLDIYDEFFGQKYVGLPKNQ